MTGYVEEYEGLVIEIIAFDTEDVVSTSITGEEGDGF